jgi:adenylate cyclase
MEARQLETTGRRGAVLAGQVNARMTLRVGSRQIECGGEPQRELRIGRAAQCDLILLTPFVSRLHARIHCRRHFFVLTDESSNGTYWRTEDGRVVFLHRQSMRLWGNGELHLGVPPGTEYGAVQFQIQDS